MPSSPTPLSLAPTDPRRGNVADYAFGIGHAWDAFSVVRFHGVEELSQPFRFTIDLARDAALGPVDLDGLIDADATLAIASASAPRRVHGVVGRAEEIDRTRAVIVYRVELEPHLARLRHRKGCRTFRQRSIKEVVAMLLEHRVPGRAGGVDPILPFAGGLESVASSTLGAFQAAAPTYRFVLSGAEASRFDDPAYRASITQFNESDFDFLSRLLEAEGVTYLFEHTEHGVVLTMTDEPSTLGLHGERRRAPIRAAEDGVRAHDLEFVRGFRPCRAVSSRAARVRHLNGDQPFKRLETAIEAVAGAGSKYEHFEFPSPGGGLPDDKNTPLFTQIELERHETARAIGSGGGSVRHLAAGARVTLHDETGERDDADVLVVAVETFGAQHETPGLEGELDPFGFAGEGRVRAPAHENRFRAVPATVRFRPERRTARPRIHGVHRAVVTSEEHGSKKEVNTNRDGDVRLRFPWDDRPAEPGVPSSNWVPVTNPWAGTGYGAMHTPRVGQTVFAAFDDGDPDQPVVLGGYYSEQTPAPYNPEESPGVTGLKSWSTPDAEGSNEIRMDDAAGDEALDLHAQKDMSIDVENDQEVTVGNDLSVEVINDYDLDVGCEVDVDVGGMVDVRLHDDLSLAVDGDAEETFGGDLTTTVTGNRQATVKGDCAEDITGDKYIGPEGDFTVEAKDVSVGAMEGKMVLKACRDVTLSGFSITAEAAKYVVVKAPNVSLAAKDLVQLGAAEIGINADHVIRLKCGGSEIVMRPGSIEIKSAEVIINGSTAVKLNC